MLKPFSQKQRGFTLIEIMVVLVIIGITITFVVLAIAHGLDKEDVRSSSENLYQKLLFAEDQAILKPSIVGFRLSEKHYNFLRYVRKVNSMGNYELVWEQDTTLKHTAFPKPVRMTLTTDNKLQNLSNINSETLPQIVFAATGEVTPFIITIGIKDKKPDYKIQGIENGEITFTKLQQQ